LPAERLKVSATSPEPAAIRYAADCISRGGLVALPTDTFYGIAADPFNLAAVEQIYRVKGRPETRALPILVNSIEQAQELSRDLPESFEKLAKTFWPGPMTLLVEAASKIPLKVTAGTGHVALRWPNSPIPCGIIDALGAPVTGTSANISGFPPCSTCEQVLKQLGERLPLVLDSGDTGASLASTIIALEFDSWRIMREGTIGEDAIRAALEE